MQLPGIMREVFGQGRSNSRVRLQSSGLLINTFKKLFLSYNII